MLPCSRRSHEVEGWLRDIRSFFSSYLCAVHCSQYLNQRRPVILERLVAEVSLFALCMWSSVLPLSRWR